MSPVQKLESLPQGVKSANLHIWADWVELLCLVNMDREVSVEWVLDRISERRDLGEVEEPDPVPTSSDETAELHDRYVREVYQWFEHLAYRAGEFEAFYPFELGEGTLRCKDGIDDDPRCRLYVFLLLASCLKYITKSCENWLANRFEIASLVALKSYLPTAGTLRLFGTNPLNSGSYGVMFRHRLELLAKELGERISSRSEGENLNHSGDGGLDVVGWVPFGDKAPGSLLLFGQCACGKGWEGKEFEAHARKWEKYISFTVPPSNVVFVPYCFRRADGRWHEQLAISDSILIDRVRMVHLLQDKLRLLGRIHPYDELVSEVLQYVEPLV